MVAEEIRKTKSVIMNKKKDYDSVSVKSKQGVTIPHGPIRNEVLT